MIHAKEISFAYHGMEPVLRSMSMEETKGHCVAFLGNNGAGKSTFLKCLNRILHPKSGTVCLEGRNISGMKQVEIAREMAYVEQHTTSSKLTVYDMVLLGRKPHMTIGPSAADYTIVDEAIARMHLEELKLRYVDELSGGELQKVALARALAQQPKVLLLDEPTASLDLRNQHEVMGIVAQIAKETDMLVIVVIHDLNLALKYCDRFLMFKEGRVFRYGDASVVTEETIKAVYGVDTTIVNVEENKFVVVK